MQLAIGEPLPPSAPAPTQPDQAPAPRSCTMHMSACMKK